MEYKHLGYYNGIDAVMMDGLDPDKIIQMINGGIGQFYTVSDECTIVLHSCENGNNGVVKFSKDKKYAVTYSVSNIAEHTPLDLLSQQDLSDEYIDVWEKMC